MNFHFDNNWSKSLTPESNYFYSAYKSKCEKTCIDKGVEKKDEDIPMSLWNQCIGNCERERDEKQKETWGKITDYAKDIRWGDVFGNIFGKKPSDTDIPPPPSAKEGSSTMSIVLIVVAVLFFLLIVWWIFSKINKTGKKNE